VEYIPISWHPIGYLIGNGIEELGGVVAAGGVGPAKVSERLRGEARHAFQRMRHQRVEQLRVVVLQPRVGPAKASS
jgi:hypothetical protein